MDNPSNNAVFDVTLKGWQFANDNPDGVSTECFNAAEALVKWVAAPNIEAVNLFLEKNNVRRLLDDQPYSLGRNFPNTISDGVDVIVDANGDVVEASDPEWLKNWGKQTADFAFEYMAEPK